MNQRIYNYSLHLLARQDYSEYKLKKKLLSKPDNNLEEVIEVIEKLLEKKNYYKASNDYLFNYLSKINSPMLRVFSITYRLGLIFSWRNLLKYKSQYIYLPIILFYRSLHLANVRIFKY
jgi:hypothetical protein